MPSSVTAGGVGGGESDAEYPDEAGWLSDSSTTAVASVPGDRQGPGSTDAVAATMSVPSSQDLGPQGIAFGEPYPTFEESRGAVPTRMGGDGAGGGRGKGNGVEGGEQGPRARWVRRG